VTEENSRNLSETKTAQVADELADVFLYLLMLSDKLGVDLIAASRSKLLANAQKYPVDLARGSSRKYTEL
jgi:NTP pyrophosphatase (non-canonical NTP hydrolase)